MQAGSFIDLLCRQTDRSTGRGFTDMSIASQALSLLGAGVSCPASSPAYHWIASATSSKG